jgi:hypothetical protein
MCRAGPRIDLVNPAVSGRQVSRRLPWMGRPGLTADSTGGRASDSRASGSRTDGSRVAHGVGMPRAQHALIWDVFVPDQRIRSTVTNGWVTLDGDVDFWAEREDAAARALCGRAPRDR